MTQLACILAFCAPALAQPPRYHAIFIYLPFAYLGDGLAINEHGAICGEAHVDAFRWTIDGGGEAIREYPNPYSQSFGYAINDHGHVTGQGFGAGILSEAFLWTHDEVIRLPDLPGHTASAFGLGINNSDWVVGKGTSSEGGEAFVWKPDDTIFGLGNGPNYTTAATDVNNRGQVCAGGLPPFVWDQINGVTKIPGLSSANAINDHGQVAGVCSATWGCVWDPDTGLHIIGDYDGYPTGLVGINDLGQAVGWIDFGVFYGFAGMYWSREHGMHRMRDLLDAWSRTYLNDVGVSGINNRGQIVGYLGIPILFQPFTLGDANCDGVVDAADLRPCLHYLATFDPDAQPTDFCGWWTCDMNQDGDLSPDDVPLLVEMILQTEAPAPP